MLLPLLEGISLSHTHTCTHNTIFSVESVTSALHSAGACRISGGFDIHTHPVLMNYMAEHSIPVELGLTDRFHIYTSKARTFSGILFDCFWIITCLLRSVRLRSHCRQRGDVRSYLMLSESVT